MEKGYESISGENTELYKFLEEVDQLFPVPLSDKKPLPVLASQLEQYGTISFVREHDQIIAVCAGYTNDLEKKLGYISVVATLPEYSNKGYGKAAVQGFIEKARCAGMKAVHLYADARNSAALHMYEKLGFVEWNIVNEPRPKDKHLIKSWG